MEANLSRNNTLVLGWVIPRKPTRSMCTTAVRRYTGGRHGISCRAHEAMPFADRRKVPLVATNGSTRVFHRTTSMTNNHWIFAFRRNINLIAVFSCESLSTGTGVSSPGVLAPCSIPAWLQTCTLINVFFAIGSLKSALTLTLVGIHSRVFAGASVLAWFLVTRIYAIGPFSIINTIK